MSDPDQMMRASDAEREAVVARLHHAVGEGRLTADEAGERIAAVDAARFRAELRAPLADLPAGGAPAGAPSWPELWAQLVWRARAVLDGPGAGRPTRVQQRLAAVLLASAALWTAMWVLLGAVAA